MPTYFSMIKNITKDPSIHPIHVMMRTWEDCRILNYKSSARQRIQFVLYRQYLYPVKVVGCQLLPSVQKTNTFNFVFAVFVKSDDNAHFIRAVTITENGAKLLLNL